jgi:hypothetical protein
MSSIGQTDQFQVFMRKIGWSVGLEDTFQRLLQLTEVYDRNGDITAAAWNDLVHVTWGLKTVLVGDFFAALNVIRPTKTGVNVLPGLDMFAILKRTIPDETTYIEAAKLVFLVLLTENDGEIFLNCLASEFEPEAVSKALQRLIFFKRRQLFDIYKVPALQGAIARIVNIERQNTNRGSTGEGKSLNGQRRTASLERRREALTARPSLEVVISEDYLRKVPPRRRDWAKSLGLCGLDGHLTARGALAIQELRAAGWATPDGDFVIWPMNHEILRLRLNAAQLGHLTLDYWTFVQTLAVAMGAVAASGTTSESIIEKAIEVLQRQFLAYQSLNRPKALLRREFPLTIAYVTIAATWLAQGSPVCALDEILKEERRSPTARIEMRSSRNSIGSLTFPGGFGDKA